MFQVSRERILELRKLRPRSDFQVDFMSQRPITMPRVLSPEIIICKVGQDAYFVCESLEEAQQLYDQYADKTVEIQWYAGKLVG
jgi:hypothetical protein